MNFIKKNGFLSTKRLIFFQPHIEKGDSFEPPFVMTRKTKNCYRAAHLDIHSAAILDTFLATHLEKHLAYALRD